MQSMSEKPKRRDRPSQRPEAPEVPREVVDRLEGLLPEEALRDALKGLSPEEITGSGGLMGQLAGRVINAALRGELTRCAPPSTSTSWRSPEIGSPSRHPRDRLETCSARKATGSPRSCASTPTHCATSRARPPTPFSPRRNSSDGITRPTNSSSAGCTASPPPTPQACAEDRNRRQDHPRSQESVLSTPPVASVATPRSTSLTSAKAKMICGRQW